MRAPRARWSSAAARCCRWALRASRGFAAGDVLDVRDADGLVIARGIAEAGHDELELAAGRHQEDIAGNHLLAALANKPAIHRDNLIVFA